ncbi:MAG: NAD(P)-binding domain-containing protein [Candidatus Lambdaproteobacteria bacterium]|nr:NAD(P)-binding domain-containing protein [Candidatus Lambdaproteobacteria bacterium]
MNTRTGNTRTGGNGGRRGFLSMVGAMAAGAALYALPLVAPPPVAIAQPAPGGDRLKIGIIGSGRIGGTLGELWVKAGHQVMLSSRHPENLKELVTRLGPLARAGTPREAAAFGDVILVSVPYGALPQIGRDYAAELRGKVVLDTGNPVARRDGAMADEAKAKGTGVASAEFLPGVRLVRAFNTIPSRLLRGEAHRAGERIGVPLAADDAEAMQIAMRLVKDAGHEPVAVGPLARAKEFDVGTPVYAKGLTAREVKKGLGIE